IRHSYTRSSKQGQRTYSLARSILLLPACAGVDSRMVRRWGGSGEMCGRGPTAHTPSKNARPISRTQAYIAYHLVGVFSEVCYALATPNQHQNPSMVQK